MTSSKQCVLKSAAVQKWCFFTHEVKLDNQFYLEKRVLSTHYNVSRSGIYISTVITVYDPWVIIITQ